MRSTLERELSHLIAQISFTPLFKVSQKKYLFKFGGAAAPFFIFSKNISHKQKENNV
jgi:hypothetical protein